MKVVELTPVEATVPGDAPDGVLPALRVLRCRHPSIKSVRGADAYGAIVLAVDLLVKRVGPHLYGQPVRRVRQDEQINVALTVRPSASMLLLIRRYMYGMNNMARRTIVT